MNTNTKVTADHLRRRAIVYIRQSSPIQVANNLESQRRQYALADQARQLGFQQVEVIDEDLGRSGSGQVERPGFARLVAEVCTGSVGAVFCIEASRLARNGRDWHHLIELCGLVRALVVDPDGIYDPGLLNDRLLLGLKGTMSEFELNLLRQRCLEAIRQKAQRGALKFALPVGYRWAPNGKVEKDPDRRIQQAIELVFAKLEESGSARQVLLWFRSEKVSLPAMMYGDAGRELVWKLPVYGLRGSAWPVTMALWPKCTWRATKPQITATHFARSRRKVQCLRRSHRPTTYPISATCRNCLHSPARQPKQSGQISGEVLL